MSLNQRKDKGNIVYLHTGLLFICLKKNDSMKVADKWMEVGKIIMSRQPRYRKTNVICIHLQVNIICKLKDSNARSHRPREPKQQGMLM